MRQSQLFVNTLREAPQEAEVTSHRLLLRAGFVRQLAAGIYTYMPLGWRVLRNIQRILREERDQFLSSLACYAISNSDEISR